MALQSLYLGVGDSVRWLNGTGGSVNLGAIIKLGNIYGQVCGSAVEDATAISVANGAIGQVRTQGLVYIPKKSGDVFAFGDNVFWDATNNYGTTTPAQGNRIGTAVIDPRDSAMPGASALYVCILLNDPPGQIGNAANALTAFAGGGQASATQLAAGINRVTTVATIADSVKLPAATAGAQIVVINAAANSMQVFGAGTDTINGVATATGVAQMGNSLVIYVCAVAGSWVELGLGVGFAGSLVTESFLTGVVAFAGGGQASAVAMTAMTNRINTVATQGDSVKLPASVAGMQIVVDNQGANPVQVFGAGTDTINGIATATGLSQGVKQIATYYCFVAGNWEVQYSLPQQAGTVSLLVNGAIPSHAAHTYVITKAGVLADTLAAPTAGTDDGLIIVITSDTANAHTLTATGLLDTGSASVNLATFAAFKGAGLMLMAFNGHWKVLSQIGITFS